MSDEHRIQVGKELAKAVVDFADWHWSGYVSNVTPEARVTVGRQLWSEVSDRVKQLTGTTPASPRFGLEGLESGADRGGRL